MERFLRVRTGPGSCRDYSSYKKNNADLCKHAFNHQRCAFKPSVRDVPGAIKSNLVSACKKTFLPTTKLCLTKCTELQALIYTDSSHFSQTDFESLATPPC